MLHSELKITHKIQLSHCPLSLELIDNELWSCQCNGITVYDINLTQVNTIQYDGIGPVYDVCDMPNGYILIAAQNGLYQTKANGELNNNTFKLITTLFGA